MGAQAWQQPLTAADASASRPSPLGGRWLALLASRLYKPTEYAAIFILVAWLGVRVFLTSKLQVNAQSEALMDFFQSAVTGILIAYAFMVLVKFALSLTHLKAHKSLLSLSRFSL